MIRRIRQNLEGIRQRSRRDRILNELFEEYSHDSFRVLNGFCLARSHMKNTELNNARLCEIAASKLDDAEAAARLAEMAMEVASAAVDRASLSDSGGSGGFGGGGFGGGGNGSFLALLDSDAR